MTKQRIVLETKNANGRCYETAINVGEDGAHNFEVAITHNNITHTFYQATMRKALNYMEACIDIDKETDKVVSNVCLEQTDEHYEESTDEEVDITEMTVLDNARYSDLTEDRESTSETIEQDRKNGVI